MYTNIVVNQWCGKATPELMSENLIYTNEYTLQSSTLRSPWVFKYCGYTHSFSFLVFHHETMNDSWRFTHLSSSNKNKTDTWWGGKIITTWSQSMALFGAKKLQESLLKLLYKQIIKFCLHLNRLTSLFSSFLLFFFFFAALVDAIIICIRLSAQWVSSCVTLRVL